MPFLQVTTDADISQEAASKVLGECAELCCNILSKPLDFMQTALNINASMTMGEQQEAISLCRTEVNRSTWRLCDSSKRNAHKPTF